MPTCRLLLAAVLLAAAATLAGCGATPIVHAQSGLDTVLSQMDAASKTFKSAEASVKRDQYDHIVHVTSEQDGTIYFLRSGGSIQTGAKFTTPDVQFFEYKSGTLRLYTPKINHLQTVAISASNQALAETLLTLGFGGSRRDLEKAWTITDKGAEMMDGVKVEQLDLVSTDPGLKKNYPHVTIWVDPVRDVSLKQVIYQLSGDTQTATYTNIKLNGKINMGNYEIKCKGTCQ